MTWDLVKGGKRPTWVAQRDAVKASRSALELSELPDGTCLRFELPSGARLVATKTNDRRWLLHGGALNVEGLAELPAVEMKRREA